MTSPINFGGGVGTQPVIQNPSIGEQLAPLLEQLQRAQAQRERQQTLMQAAAQAERDQQLKALTLLANKSNDLAFLDSEAGRELGGLAGAPEAVDTLVSGMKDQVAQQLAELEELAVSTFPGTENTESAQKFLLVLKHDLNPQVDASVISEMMGQIFGPSDLEVAQTALAQERARQLRNQIETEARGAKNEKLKEAANQRVAEEFLKVTYVEGVDYIGVYEATLKRDPATMVAGFARAIIDQQTLLSKIDNTRPNSIASSIEQAIVITEGIRGEPFDRSLQGPLQMELSMESSADGIIDEIRQAREDGSSTLELVVPMVDPDTGEQLEPEIVTFDDPKLWRNDAAAKNLMTQELRKRFPEVDPKKIRDAIKRSFTKTTKFQ